MQKVFGMALVVGLIWVGLEIYVEGMERAFGGALVRFGVVAPSAPEGSSSPLDRIRARAIDAREQQMERIEREAD
jgi:hypothetical protein